MILACSADENYTERIAPYLASLAQHSPCDNVLLCADCAAPDRLPPRVRAVAIDTSGMVHTQRQPQSGGFVDSLPGDPDDVIIFTDGDIIMQRAPTAAEYAYLEQWPAGVVGMGYNATPHDTLYDEYWRLGPKALPQAMDVLQFLHAPIYNAGVIVAQRHTWERWYGATKALWPQIDRLFTHYARQQFAMCLALAQAQIPVSVLPYTLHTHGCYLLPHGAAWDGKTLSYVGTPVLWRHHL
jgi:hypothetical protein